MMSADTSAKFEVVPLDTPTTVPSNEAVSSTTKIIVKDPNGNTLKSSGNDPNQLSDKLSQMDDTLFQLGKKVDYLIVTHEKSVKNLQSAIVEKHHGLLEDDFAGDENTLRGNWSGRFDFLLSCLGYAVGLGNVWRFPYLCYRNGGGAFFIPYCLMLFFVGMPIFFLELSLGQYTSSGPLTSWNFAPIFTGIGLAMVVVSALVGIYYNMIIAWSIYYLFASFTSKLPWAECGEWSSDYCNLKLKDDAVNCTNLGAAFNTTATGLCLKNGNVYGIWNKTLAAANGIKARVPSEDYLDNVVWGKSESKGLHDLGPVRWQLALCLLCAWIIVFLSLIKGIKSSGKVVYFTAIFPYVVLVILLIRGLTLPGYEKGIDFYLKPDMTRLQTIEVWKDAAVQIFFSLSASWGGLIALASYNRFHTNTLRDTLIVSIGNCLTSVFAGFVIFSFLGFLAHELNVDVKDVATSGVGLAFVVYPDAVTRMPVSTLWSILFFFMLITLGLDSQFALIETIATAFIDRFPSMFRKRKWLFMLILSIIFYILGLTMCTNGGAYMLQLMDSYAGGWNVLLIALFECIAVAMVYGARNFTNDIELMIGRKTCGCPWKYTKWWWCICWCVITPLGVTFILVLSWIEYKPISFDDYVYPQWANALGWMMTLVVVVSIFIPAVYMSIITPGSCLKRVTRLMTPTVFWGPALVKHRKLVKHYKNFVVDPWGDEEIKKEPSAYTNPNIEFDEGEQNMTKF